MFTPHFWLSALIIFGATLVIILSLVKILMKYSRFSAGLKFHLIYASAWMFWSASYLIYGYFDSWNIIRVLTMLVALFNALVLYGTSWDLWKKSKEAS